MATVGRVVADIVANTAQFEEGLNRSAAQARQWGGDVGGSMGKVAGGGSAVDQALRKLGGGGKFQGLVNELRILSHVTGVQVPAAFWKTARSMDAVVMAGTRLGKANLGSIWGAGARGKMAVGGAALAAGGLGAMVGGAIEEFFDISGQVGKQWVQVTHALHGWRGAWAEAKVFQANYNAELAKTNELAKGVNAAYLESRRIDQERWDIRKRLRDEVEAEALAEKEKVKAARERYNLEVRGIGKDPLSAFLESTARMKGFSEPVRTELERLEAAFDDSRANLAEIFHAGTIDIDEYFKRLDAVWVDYRKGKAAIGAGGVADVGAGAAVNTGAFRQVESFARLASVPGVAAAATSGEARQIGALHEIKAAVQDGFLALLQQPVLVESE